MFAAVEKPLLTRAEVADLLGVSIQTVSRLVRAGKLTGVTVGERFIRIPFASLEQYLSKQTEGGEQ